MPKSVPMECLFCLSSGAEPLQDNTACQCRYKRHISCWIDYVHSKPTLQCPTCRKDLTSKRQVPTASTPLRPWLQPSAPYAPELQPIPEEPLPAPRTENTSFSDKANKFLKIVFVLSILAAALVLIWIFA
jgi:hypothetical protein